MSASLTLRPGTPADIDACSAICFDAFGALNARHNFPSDFPNRRVTAGLFGMLLNMPQACSVIAEQNGRIVGSNFLWEGGAVAGVGPISVDPSAQGGVGRRLMEAVLTRASEKQTPSVRLVQAAFNTTSMSLYTKLGFDVREPLVCMQGPAIGKTIAGYQVRAATEADLAACGDISRRVHGHDREGELRGAIPQGTASVVERGGQIVGYATDIGFFGHAVALDNPALMALISAVRQITGPGMLLPSRNGEVFRWCLANGLRMVQPMTLMSLGLYNEPRGAFIPSILF
jgi:predicted N-acetyltransferase YhbS